MFGSVKYRAYNLQKGVTLISYKQFVKKVNAYISQKTENPMGWIKSNLTVRSDVALFSVCVDKVLEEYLHSGFFTLKNMGVIVNPFRYAPKTAVIMFYTKVPTSIRIKVVGAEAGLKYRDVSSLKQYHRISITGLGNGTNRIFLSVYNENGTEIAQYEKKLFMANVGTMEEQPIVEKTISTKSSYNNILVTGGNVNPFVFDKKGAILHFFQFKNYSTSQYGIYLLGNGRFLWPVRQVAVPTFTNPYSCLFYEMDFMGRISKTYHIKKGIHHAVAVLPNGNMVSVSNSLKGHTADILVEIDRTNGKIVRTVDLQDVFGVEYKNQIDWIHPNSLEYNEEEDSMLICMRNIHTVAKINWTSLEIIWMLSLPKLWESTDKKDKLLRPEGKVHYSFQAHAAYELKDLRGTDGENRFYLVFNNNRLNRRPIKGYEDDGYSYIAIYAIDEKEKIVKQIKNLQIEKSIVRSNAQYDVHNKRLYNMSGCLSKDTVNYRGCIEEYDYDTEKCLNRFHINKDFYSAYEFQWRTDDYCTPISDEDSKPLSCGETDPLTIYTGELPDAIGQIEEECYSRAYIVERDLYFKTKDHSISALLLVGKRHTYQRDYTNTWQTLSLHADRVYYCVVSLLDLEPDLYEIKILKDGNLYNTEDYIEIIGNSVSV